VCRSTFNPLFDSAPADSETGTNKIHQVSTQMIPTFGKTVFQSMNHFSIRRKPTMNNSKNVTVLFTLLALLIAAPMMASAKQSAKFSVSRTLVVAGHEIQPGDFKISWDSNKSDVMVTFESNGKVEAEVQGKIVEGDMPSEYDSLNVEQDPSGRDIIKEIRFRGKKQKVVFE
jgi:hypothetical protein